MTIRRALISVSDKTGLLPFAQFLVQQGVELLSTGGTAELLRKNNLPVRDVSEVTDFPEMMDGRVKTLHPRIHGGLLARRPDPAHMAAATDHNIPMIDLLIVNLYPFETTLNTTTDYDHLVENIDIGGPAMIRAAAKNHESVTTIVDITDYELLQQLMQQNANTVPLESRKKFAAKAFARCASYDTLISSWLTNQESDAASAPASPAGEATRLSASALSRSGEGASPQTQPHFPSYFLDAKLAQRLRYGENPHQSAALYQRLDAKGGLANATVLQGKELSYNNLADADAAWNIASTLATPTAVLIKHANPCGVATADTITAAFTAALASDPVSAFGGILAVNREVDTALVTTIAGLFLEVIIAPSFTPEARETLSAKKNLRLLIAEPETHASPLSNWIIQPISGGYLVQTADTTTGPNSPLEGESKSPFAISVGGNWKQVSGTPLTTHDSPLTRDAALAWHTVKYVKSNAIVLVKNGATIGVGAGQMSRVDSVRIAIEKARAHGHDTTGATLASDAFFPFADNVELAAAAGITLIIQPGGSMRDPEVITAATNHNITMLFTGTRHFRH